MKEEKILGCIGVFYRKNNELLEFLVVENSAKGNITFVSGAKEDEDNSEIETMRRETEEELGIKTDNINFRPTGVRHEFIFGPNKKDRDGLSGSYQVFIADVTGVSDQISHTKELKSIKWLNKDEVLQTLSFPDLKEVFLEVLNEISY